MSDYDLTEMAWVIIANVSEGDWFKQTDEWREAAIKWRGKYHEYLGERKYDLEEANV